MSQGSAPPGQYHPTNFAGGASAAQMGQAGQQNAPPDMSQLRAMGGGLGQAFGQAMQSPAVAQYAQRAMDRYNAHRNNYAPNGMNPGSNPNAQAIARVDALRSAPTGGMPVNRAEPMAPPPASMGLSNEMPMPTPQGGGMVKPAATSAMPVNRAEPMAPPPAAAPASRRMTLMQARALRNQE